ncbi:MAG: glycosyltransferase [Lactobacillales bacterium]|jgi:rhamnosyltransferase|nr:glycosyltransferase [Lactobacillales bacterium]
MYNGKKIGLFVPTRNGKKDMGILLERVKSSENLFDEKLAIDTESTDLTVRLLKGAGFQVQMIEKQAFNHGRVRKIGIELLHNCDYVVMVTQDVQPTRDAFLKLIQFIDEHDCMASAYGRQLVDKRFGSVYEARSRRFNYPEGDCVKSMTSINKLGIKTIFQSDAFVVYDVGVVQALGNFPEKIPFAEDQYMAAKAILSGYTVGYAAGAIVYHQHNYTLREEYQRMKLVGRFNREYKELLSSFGTNEKEGLRYVFSELKYYWGSGNVLKIPKFLVVSIIKFLGYKVGEKERRYSR